MHLLEELSSARGYGGALPFASLLFADRRLILKILVLGTERQRAVVDAVVVQTAPHSTSGEVVGVGAVFVVVVGADVGAFLRLLVL